MATPYIRYEDYSDFQSDNPDTPLSGASLDIELDRIKTTTDSLQSDIEDVRRDDGALVNGIVTLDSLDDDMKTLVGEWNPRGNWVTATAYAARDFVNESGVGYVCIVAHTSGTFATDLAAGKWMQLVAAAGVAAATITFSPTGTIASTDVQAAIAEVSGDVTALTATVSGKQASDATLTALAAVTTAADKLIYATASDTFATADLTSAARSLLDDPSVAAMRTTLDVQPTADPAFTGSFTLTDDDAGASAGPDIRAFRDSGSPAASDAIGRVVLSGNDSGSNETEYAVIVGEIVDPTNGSEDGRMNLQTMQNGTLATRGYVENGYVIGSPTGNDKGAGTLNVENGVYGDGNLAIDGNGHLRLRSYTVATLPSSGTAGEMVYCSDETGGAVPVFHDGTNWRRVTDRMVAA